jgi:GNAT superfamily N-acetyltransferase
MITPFERMGPSIWPYLVGCANREPDGLPEPLQLHHWTGPSTLHRHAHLEDWVAIARSCASPAEERPHTMAIGIAGSGEVAGYLESLAPNPATCARGISLLREAGAARIITVCRPTPGGLLHMRSLLAAAWWERAASQGGLPVMHTYLPEGADRPLPFTWPELANEAPPPIQVQRNPDLSPDQLQIARRLQYDPTAPLRYVAFLGSDPVGVASVRHGPLGDFGEDAAARWSAPPEEPVCLVKWISSVLMGWSIGSRLYAAIESDALAAGLSRVVLEAAPFTTTDRFWRRHGFQMVARDRRTPYRYMEKSLLAQPVPWHRRPTG